MICRSFAEEEFSHAQLGDPRRTRRVVRMVSQLEEKPGGKITDVFPRGAAREAAYRCLENEHVKPEELERARNVACMGRMERLGGTIVVAVDRASIQLSDRDGVR